MTFRETADTVTVVVSADLDIRMKRRFWNYTFVTERSESGTDKTPTGRPDSIFINHRSIMPGRTSLENHIFDDQVGADIQIEAEHIKLEFKLFGGVWDQSTWTPRRYEVSHVGGGHDVHIVAQSGTVIRVS